MNNTKLYELLEDAMQGKRDLMFADVISNIHCMSRARVYAIINAVVSSLEEGEIYVEVGAYQGGSLISALLGNISKAIGVDSFSEFKETNSYEQTQRNLETYKVDDRATLLNMSYQEFFAELSPDFRIRAYYYDGEHNYHGQLAGMEAAWKFLSSGSLVLVDDYFYPEVSRAVNDFVHNHAGSIRFLFVMSPREGLDANWWNGVVVMQVT
jgi:hypothetical protein